MAKGDKEAKGDKPAKAGKSEKAPKAEKAVKAPKVPGEKKGEQCLYLRYEFLKSCFTVVLRSRHFLGGSASLRSRSRLRLQLLQLQAKKGRSRWFRLQTIKYVISSSV